MRVLIIGGVKFIGFGVARELLAGGHTVALYHRGGSEPEELRDATHIHGDRDDLVAARDQFAAFQPDVAIHMIAMTAAHGEAFTRALIGIAQRGVVISSQDVYRAFGRVNGVESGAPESIPLTEDSPLRERIYPYRGDQPRAADDPARWMDDYDKILVERAVMAEPALPCSVIRLPAVYGPRDFQRRFRPWLKRMDDGRSAILMDEADANWRWTHGYVDDVAHAITLATLDPRSASHIYNVGEREALSWQERAQRVAEAVGWDGRIVAVPSGRLPEQMRIVTVAGQDIVISSDRIRAGLDYAEVTPVAETYARAIAWERANPPASDNPAEYDYAEEDRILADLG